MEKKKNFKTYLSLIKIGCIGFGGGNALIPVIQDEIVDKNKIITQEEYEEDIVIASITPGALPVELSAGIGKRIAGRSGMIAGAMSMALPGALLTIILLALLTGAPAVVYAHIAFVTVGVMAYISSLLFKYVSTTVESGKKSGRTMLIGTIIITFLVFFATSEKNFYRILDIDRQPMIGLSTVNVFAVAFFIIFYTNGKFNNIKAIVSIIISLAFVLSVGSNPVIRVSWFLPCIEAIMLVLAVYGLIVGIKTDINKKTKLPFREIRQDLLVTIIGTIAAALLARLVVADGIIFVLKGFLSSIMSFGGGDAYITIADGMFVDGGLLSEDLFYSQLVPVVNIVPGSILCKTLSGVGYLVGYESTGSVLCGIVVAAGGFICSVVASSGVFSLIGDLYLALSELSIFNAIKEWIRPIVSGLMLTVISSLLHQSAKFGMKLLMNYELLFLMLAIFFVEYFLSRKKVASGIRVLIGAALSYGIGWLLFFV